MLKLLVLVGAFAYIAILIARRLRIPAFDPLPGSPPPPVDNPVRSCYVASMGTDSVAVFEIADGGLLNPIAARTIGGILTVGGAESGLLQPYDVAVTADGVLFVLELNGEDQPTTLSVFPPGSNGATSPSAQFPNDQVQHATGIALRRIPLAVMVTMVDEGKNGVVMVDRDPATGGEPLASISGAATTLVAPTGVAVRNVDSVIFVVGPTQDQVAVFAAFHPTSANAGPPTRVITGPHTMLSQPMRVAVDAMGQIYVTNRGNGAITIFAADAGGDAAPLRVIAGPHTGLTQPMGIAVDPDGRIYVANQDSLLVFGPDDNGDIAPAQRIDPTAQNMLSQTTGVSYRVPPGAH
jgi:hypothetical protein